MSNLLEKCEEYFHTRDFYEILSINRDATEKQIKKAYHRLSLLVHPDRVEETKKVEATEKFKVLGKVHSILQDSDKRKIYDECGEFNEENDTTFNWMDYWTSMFKKINSEDIQNYEKEYIGSETEVRDIKKAYVTAKGNMDLIIEMVPFSNCDSEPRIIEIVRKLVDDGEVEEYDKFFNEPQKKKNKRRRFFEKEKKEFEKLNISDQDLEEQIQKNHEKRKKEFCNFLNSLETKYSKTPKKRTIKDSTNSTAKRRFKRSK